MLHISIPIVEWAVEVVTDSKPEGESYLVQSRKRLNGDSFFTPGGSVLDSNLCTNNTNAAVKDYSSLSRTSLQRTLAELPPTNPKYLNTA
jgi:hypothetical protein